MKRVTVFLALMLVMLTIFPLMARAEEDAERFDLTVTDEGNGFYRLNLDGVPENAGGVKFFTWSIINSRDDIVVYEGKYEEDGSFSAVCDVFDHLNAGTYMTEAYIKNGRKLEKAAAVSYRTKVEVPEEGSRHGWYHIDDGSYYYGRSDGILKKDTVVNGISLDEDGRAVMDEYAKEKIPLLIAARLTVQNITDPEDTLEEKQEKCYQYIAGCPYVLKEYPLKDYRGRYACYDAHYANNILDAYGDQTVRGGDCVALSAALGYLYTELDFGTVYLNDDTQHAWIEVDGHTWDPLFTRSKGRQWYNRDGYTLVSRNSTEI